MSELGKNLQPTKLGIKPGTGRKISPNSKPDQFGQVNSSEKDLTKGNIPSAQESVQQHFASDVDSAQRAQHHTLGPGRNQASPGNHIHDGTTSPKLGPLEMDPVSGTRPALTCGPTAADIRTFLHNFINFRDV